MAKEAEELIKELQKHKAKENDPNATPEERERAKKMIPIIQNQLDEKSGKVNDYDKKIDELLKNIPGSGGNKGVLTNFQPDFQTKIIIAVVVFAVIFFMIIKDKEK